MVTPTGPDGDFGSVGGFEPAVGEIRAVRTFRIGPAGVLYPLFSSNAWLPGENRAACRLARAGSEPHESPDPGCSCGFYAYATAGATAEYPHAQHVLAVISCWGHVVAGTRGLRAERARIEAVWLSPAVPTELAAQLSATYPDVERCATREDLLRRFPPTELDCYEAPAPDARRRRWLDRAAVTGAIVLGVIPAGWLGLSRTESATLLAALVLLVAALLVRQYRSTETRSRRRTVLYVSAALWMAAPLSGALGVVLLRIPLVELAVLSLGYRFRLRRAAGRFPADIY